MATPITRDGSSATRAARLASSPPNATRSTIERALVVARALADATARDPQVAAEMQEIAERQFNARLSAYRDALATRAPARPRRRDSVRRSSPSPADHFARSTSTSSAAASCSANTSPEANGALRETFGKASLPENVPPSARSERHAQSVTAERCAVSAVREIRKAGESRRPLCLPVATQHLDSAEGGTRTPTGIRPLRPERSASTNSTTSAKSRRLHRLRGSVNARRVARASCAA